MLGAVTVYRKSLSPEQGEFDGPAFDGNLRSQPGWNVRS